MTLSNEFRVVTSRIADDDVVPCRWSSFGRGSGIRKCGASIGVRRSRASIGLFASTLRITASSPRRVTCVRFPRACPYNVNQSGLDARRLSSRAPLWGDELRLNECQSNV